MNCVRYDGALESRDRVLSGHAPSGVAAAVVAALGTWAFDVQPAAAQGGALEEVVVTARFREENLQQTPIAVSAFTSEALEARSIFEVENLGEFVPNAFIRPSGTTPFVGMRGKINGDVFANFEPTTAVYIDGTYWGRQVGMNLDLYDIERVEVLRGPQGTLFGKNALAGAIRVVSQRPEGDNTGYAEVSYGAYQQVELRGAFDVPINDSWNMRVTGVSKKQDGYIDRLDWACQMKLEGTPELAGYGDGIGGAQQVATSPFGTPIYEPVYVEPGSPEDLAFAFPERQETEKDEVGHPDGCKFGTFRGTDQQGGRVQLRFVGNDTMDLVLSADVTEEASDSFGAVMYQGPSTLSVLDQWWIQGEVLPEYGLTPETFTGGTPDPRDGAFWRDPESYQVFETLDDPMNDQDWDKGQQLRNWGASVLLEKDLGPNLGLTYIGSYRELASDFSGRSGTTQGDSTPFDYIHNYDTFDHTQVQNELRFNGMALDNRLDWTLGAFYFYSKDQNHVNVEIEPLTFLGIFPPKLHRDKFVNTNQSVFAHGVYSVSDRLSVTGGIRWTDEERVYEINQLGILVLNEPITTEASRSDWKVGIDYAVSPDRMIYASAATGFRSAGFQPRPWTPSQVLPFDQEEVTSYELGFKGDFLDRSLRLNVAAFFESYDPRVISVGATQCNEFNAESPGEPFFDEDLVEDPVTGSLVCPPGTPMAGTTGFNFSPYISAPGEIEGIEIELTANPTDRLALSYTLGYNQFRSNEGDPQDPAYRHPDRLLQPETNMSAGISYLIDLPNGAVLSPRLDVAYQGHNIAGGDPRTAPDPAQKIPSYTLYNLRMTYETPGADWRASLAVRNLTDEFYWYAFQNPVNGGFSVPGSPGAPRMWTLSLRRQF